MQYTDGKMQSRSMMRSMRWKESTVLHSRRSARWPIAFMMVVVVPAVVVVVVVVVLMMMWQNDAGLGDRLVDPEYHTADTETDRNTEKEWDGEKERAREKERER